MYYASEFSGELTGWLAVLAFLLIVYVFVYTPIKLAVKVVAHIKARAARVRKLNSNVIIAEYDPPDGLAPAEIGYLFDTKLGIEEVFATVVSLEQRGLVQLDHEQDKLVIKEVKDYPHNLKALDRYTLTKLGTNRGGKITKRWLKNISIGGRWALDRELTGQGYLRPMTERIKIITISLVSVTLGLLLLPLYALHPRSVEDFSGFILFSVIFGPFFFVAAVFLLIAYNKIAGESGLGTKKLKDLWPDIEGYRQFIKMVEEDNLKFESENTKGLVRNKVLPYAIALGFDTGWQKKL